MFTSHYNGCCVSGLDWILQPKMDNAMKSETVEFQATTPEGYDDIDLQVNNLARDFSSFLEVDHTKEVSGGCVCLNVTET